MRMGFYLQISLLLFLLLQPFSFAFAQSSPDEHLLSQLCKVLALIQGGYGAMLMSIAGLSAFVAAAMGAYKTCLSVIVVGAGTWILYPIITLFVGSVDCQKLEFIDRVLPVGGLN